MSADVFGAVDRIGLTRPGPQTAVGGDLLRSDADLVREDSDGAH